jgi:hypothetical protein
MEKSTALVIANSVVMDEYEKRVAQFEIYMEGIKPKRDDYPSDEAYIAASNKWDMDLFCDRPNKPGYYRANND